MMMTGSRGGQQEGMSRLDRKTIEKNRRLQMKGLCFKLATILPRENGVPREALTQLDYLDQATGYIKHLQGKLDALKERRGKRVLAASPATPSTLSSSIGGRGPAPTPAPVVAPAPAVLVAPVRQLPFVEIRDLGSSLETVLICSEPDGSAAAGFVFYEVLAALEEEGAHVLNASYSMVNSKMIYTIHSQIPLPRVGTEVARVADKLKKLLSC